MPAVAAIAGIGWCVWVGGLDRILYASQVQCTPSGMHTLDSSEKRAADATAAAGCAGLQQVAHFRFVQPHSRSETNRLASTAVVQPDVVRPDPVAAIDTRRSEAIQNRAPHFAG